MFELVSRDNRRFDILENGVTLAEIWDVIKASKLIRYLETHEDKKATGRYRISNALEALGYERLRGIDYGLNFREDNKENRTPSKASKEKQIA